MNDPQADTAEFVRRAREAQALVNAYHRVFGSEDGKRVLQDIRESFGTDKPAFLRSRSPEYDPIYAAIRDGQRSVELHIITKLAADVVGDANIENPAVEVLT